MSNTIYEGKGQVPLYGIYRHSVTPWGPQEGRGDDTSLGTTVPVPGMAPGRGSGSQEQPHAARISAPAQRGSHFLCLPALLPPSKEPQKLRLGGGSCPLRGVPLSQKKYASLHTKHEGEGRDTMGEGGAGSSGGGWARPPASGCSPVLPQIRRTCWCF